MTGSTINDHFVLETYTSSSLSKGSKKHGPGVFAASYKKSNTTDGYVTVAAQADGIHIIDVSTLHPVISHTLGPSTSFACPPLSLPSSSSQASSTYAIISTSPELSSNEESGRLLWMWQDDSSSGKRKDKKSNVVLSEGQTAYGLYACPELSDTLVAVSTKGEISVINAESLEVKASASSKSSNVIYVSLYAADTTPFSTFQNGAILLLCQAGTNNTTNLRIYAIDDANSISEQCEHEISIDSQKVVSVSCSRAGVLSVLCLDGTLSSYRLSSDKISPLSTPLHLTGFSFISSASSLPISLLALTSSHVLLAAISSREITILLWDVQFSVLLASHTFSIPSVLSASTLQIRLVHGVQNESKNHTQVLGQAILILSSDTPDNKTTSVLLVVPYSVPTASTIAGAMGRGAAGKKWLHTAIEQGDGGVKQSEEEVARAKMLATMQTAMQAGRPQAAVAAFMKWAPAREDAVLASLDYNFVKELLNTVLQPPAVDAKAAVAASDVAYAPDIVQYLLDKRVVSSAMVPTPGGLLGALRARDDWKSIETAFSKVLDLNEAEIIECLRFVVAHHSASAASAATVIADGMDVDLPVALVASHIPPLPTMLGLAATYPTSRGPLLVAVHRYIPEATELTAILHTLNDWIAQRTNMEKQLMPSKKDIKKTELGIWVVTGRKHEGKGSSKDVPPLEKIVDFIQVILDASFLTLLQHAPAHKVLRSIYTQLNPEIAFAGAAETLRGPLEPFAIAQDKAVKESLIPQQERDREKQKGDWRQRRKGVGAAAGVAADIGLYQLEELVL
ncbi:hypothetical protein HYPSUDRAFT_195963 [Hypholoma sublateritium FD-334 SS-4]|uniref:Uncharacterized protein n=1 Tax=Hypholoma sublateritium (strain FD-334 SS-4) TaxID=945553 RepID=A0A0D2PFR2_HYPSF|nr:hypothetical protein HYPSUDRAFT_195963 [Hypholoma sublateritium FD-334 SS-4]